MISSIYRRGRRGGMLAAIVLLVAVAASAAPAQTRKRPALDTQKATQSAPAYRSHEHGYRAGYEDGFAQGKADTGGERLRDLSQNDNYSRADRTYQDRMGTYIEYQEGYRAGFELGYGDGFYGRAYSTAIPANLSRVVTTAVNAQMASRRPREADDRRRDDERRADRGPDRSADRIDDRSAERRPIEETRRPIDDRTDRNDRTDRTVGSVSGNVPSGIQMKIRLTSRISTKDSREGDRFTATVLDPLSYADAEVVGHIAKLKQSGSASGKTELSFAFDTITLSDGRTLKLDAQVERVYESETVKTTDEEGNIESSSRTKDTAVRTGGGAVLGAILGGLAGGGKGAAIGAVIGAGVGATSVYIEGGKNLTLEPGTEMLIKTAGPVERER
jgi:hypothetical protein